MAETFRIDLERADNPAALLRAVAVLASVAPWRLDAIGVEGVGSKAGQSGAGRVHRLARAIHSLPPDDASELLHAIGEITRPMAARELEKALMQTDLGFKARKAVVAALKAYEIVAVVPR